MPLLTPDTAGELADQVLPLDGPYDPEGLITAAALVAELVRRLNHATIARKAFRYPSELDRTLAGIKAAMYGLPQLFGQLATELERFHQDPALYSDRIRERVRVDPALDPAELMSSAHDDAVDNLEAAGHRANWCADVLRAVTSHTHTLGLDTPDVEDQDEAPAWGAFDRAIRASTADARAQLGIPDERDQDEP
jgi:hypothetical protein